MPNITTIRVMRMRKVQPEQFGNAGAEVEMFANVLEGESPMDVARDMLNQTRALVYENLGMQLPASAKAALEEMATRDTAEEAANVTIETVATGFEEPAVAPKKRRGRPPGSTNARPKAGTAAAEAHLAGSDASLPDDETVSTPATDEPAPAVDPTMPADEEVSNISSGEARVGPDDDPTDHGADMPPEDAAPKVAEKNTQEDLAPWEGGDAEEAALEYTALALQNDLRKYCPSDDAPGVITVQQGRQIMATFKVTRTRDLTQDQVMQAKKMLDTMVAAAPKK